MTDSAANVGGLGAVVDGARLIGDPTVAVTGLEYDSRLVREGNLFAALRGADRDGHQYIGDARRRGAGALLVEEVVDSPLPQIVCDDSRAALARVSAAFFRQPSRDIGVIGITGTDGKTTTSFIVEHLLRSHGLRTGMIGTVAIRIGEQESLHASRQTTPESSDVQRYLRQMAEQKVDWCVLEATSHGLAMHRLDETTFRIGAVTNITHEHLDFHGSVTAYRRAKGILFERTVDADGVAVVNIDDPGARSISSFASGGSLMSYSPSGGSADVQALNMQSTASGTHFDLSVMNLGVAPVVFPLIGAFNIANAVCAAAIAVAAGMDLESIARSLPMTPPVPGRMAVVGGSQPFTVVVDYAHTPGSLEKVLELLRSLHPGGKVIVVFGSAGERDVEKRPLQGAVAARLADVSVVTSEDPRHEDPQAIIDQIAQGAKDAGAQPGVTLFLIVDRRDAIRQALALASAGDCVLLAGKGHEGSMIWGREKVPWDEAAVARELLAELGHGSAAV